MNNAYADGKGPATPAPAPKPAAKATPGPNPGLRQIDGNQSTLGNRPTKASLQDRPSTSTSGRSGMEGAMASLADQLHPPKFKGRR